MATEWGAGGLAEEQGPEPRTRARDDRRYDGGGRQRGGGRRRRGRLRGVVGQSIDLLELALNRLRQSKGIQPRA